MLTFRNMQDMEKDEIKGFFREGCKIGCAVYTKGERQKLLEAFSRSKETGFPQFVLVYEKEVLIGYIFLYGEEGSPWIIHNADEKTYEQEKEMLVYGRDLCRRLDGEKLADFFRSSWKKWNAWEKAIERRGKHGQRKEEGTRKKTDSGRTEAEGSF